MAFWTGGVFENVGKELAKDNEHGENVKKSREDQLDSILTRCKTEVEMFWAVMNITERHARMTTARTHSQLKKGFLIKKNPPDY